MMMNKHKSLFFDIYYQGLNVNRLKLYDHAKDNIDLIQRMGLMQKLSVHDGCVNTISWNHSGEYLLSGSDDQHLIITHGHNYKVLVDYSTSHHANIFSAKFLPCCNDQQIVSCSGDGIILHTDLVKPKETYNNQFNCHLGTTYEVITIPNDSNTFLSCGEDGMVRWFDLRTKTSCNKQKCREDVLIANSVAVTALAINPMTPHQLAIGCSDSTVRIYDRRCLTTADCKSAKPFCNFTAPDLEDRPYRITSLSYSPDAQDMLVSYSCDHLYLFGVRDNESVALKKNGKLRGKFKTGKRERRSPPPVRRLRLRGDWSDTGPDARPERETTSSVSIISQARPQLQGSLMQRMTDVLSRMLNDPMTRAALSAGGEDSLDQQPQQQNAADNRTSQENNPENTATTTNDNSANVQNNTTTTGNAANEIASPSSSAISEAGSSPGVYDTSNSSMDTTTSSTETQELTPNVVAESSESELSAMETSDEAESTSSSQQSTTSTPINTSIVTRHLRQRLSVLRSLRQGFIEQHGTEPSVSLRYSEQSTSNSTISLRPGNFMSDENADIPSTSGASNSDQKKDQSSADVDLDYAGDCDTESDGIQMDDEIFEPQIKKKYVGHRNARTMIKEATFWGNDYIMSGSDCGHVFVWDRNTANLKMLLQADSHVVNCLQPHPTLPILATSGIDHDIKLWAPVMKTPSFDSAMAQNLISRNAIMLEETRDTITVPASFMIRMLACLNQIRQGARRVRPRENE